MSTRGNRRRSTIFHRYSANLALWRPELKRNYMCPLCLEVFEESAIIGPNPLLTEEHCISDGLGDRIVVLTCVECNSAAGSMVDNHLQKRMDFADFGAGMQQKPFTGRLKMFDKDMGVEVSRSPGRIDFRIRGGLSDPEKVKAVQEALSAGETPGPINLSLGPRVVPDARRSRISILKAAYLLIFRHFGYGYILSSILDPVREQIRDPRSDAVSVDSIIFNVDLAKLPDTIGFITQPKGLGGFGVPVPLSNRGAAYFGILPSDNTTLDRWREFSNTCDKRESIQFSYDLIPFDETLLTAMPFNWETR